jgi:histidinol dehydrogenase
MDLSNGANVSQRYVPMDSVGLYVPGGKAVYPSSVVMNVVPAQVAGVESIFLASPGQKEFGGRPHPTVLATAEMLGVRNVLCIGGPAAIASFAYGLPEIDLPQVRLITGPGNAYVAAAKKIARQVVAIDSEAGTTEILIIADRNANPKFVAADLISQAEHDESAAAVLLTDSAQLIEDVTIELARQVKSQKHSTRIEEALSGQQSALVLVDSIDQALAISNSYATEHLQIMVSDPSSLLPKIRNAGAVFLGNYSPVSLGDYLAGSNHVLPTGGAAKFSSGLGVHTFLRPQQAIDYSAAALSELSKSLPVFASAEDLPAHGEAVNKRFES